jgi:DNA-binding CsgD family transcriptional regulator
VGTDALDDAVDAGVLVVDGDRVRPSHPLVAAAAVKRSRARDRRELHTALAESTADNELRVLHLALATELPDSELASRVAAAAREASARGRAAADAVVLGEHALRLTPADAPERIERVFELGRYLEVAGERQRMTDLIDPELESLPAGPLRVKAHLLLAGGTVADNDEIQAHLEAALAAAGTVARARAPVLAEMAENVAAVRVERVQEAEGWALEALRASRRAGPDAERVALYALAWTRSMSGNPIDDLCERFRGASDDAFYIAQSPERIAGQRLVWRGEIGPAREALTRLMVMADERGEPSSYALQRLHLCELELRTGGWDEAERLLEEWAEFSERELLLWPMYERCRALLAAGRGDVGEAERWATEAIALAERTGNRWDMLEALRARGVAALLSHDAARAADSLRTVWARAEREGVDDPGTYPVAPDLVEALVEAGDLGEARAVTGRLAALSEQQEHPWGLAGARRCAALVRLAGAYDERPAEELRVAAAAYGALGLPFERARSLLALGRAQRRAKKWGMARESLTRSAAAFDRLGSPGWADDARSELQRVGARRASPAGELTPAERRVAELAADGLANKEIAQALVVTVNTVEFHLRNVYAKLGVRSRARLAALLVTAGGGD